MAKKSLLFFIIIVLMPLSETIGKNIPFNVDGGSFRYDSAQSIYEIYYSYPDSVLTYKQNEGMLSSELKFQITFFRADSLFRKNEWMVDYSRNPESKENMELFGQKNILLPIGTFKMQLKVSDMLDEKNTFFQESTIESKDFSSNKVQFSDIELVRMFEAETNSSRNWSQSFLKNGLYVIPNPTKEIIGSTPKINIYAEIYNAKSNLPEDFILEYRLLDPIKTEVLFYPKKKKATSDGMVETIEMPVDAVNSGVYTLEMKIKYSSGKKSDSVTTSKKLYILNPDLPPVQQSNFYESQSYERSEFASMSEEQVELDYAKSLYIASKYEKELYKKCTTTDAKKHFMYSFWKKRNLDPAGSINMEREKYMIRAAYANQYYSYGNNNQGWKSDRGRILMTYGEPTEKDVITPIGANRSYEKWFYADLLGGAYFYFVDVGGYGNYLLVNSTIPGEVMNDNWFNDWVVPKN